MAGGNDKVMGGCLLLGQVPILAALPFLQQRGEARVAPMCPGDGAIRAGLLRGAAQRRWALALR